MSNYIKTNNTNKITNADVYGEKVIIYKSNNENLFLVEDVITGELIPGMSRRTLKQALEHIANGGSWHSKEVVLANIKRWRASLA